jgi:hypothetical protein
MNLIMNQDIHLLIAGFIPDHLCWHCLTLSHSGYACCMSWRFLYEGQFVYDLEDAGLTVCPFCLFNNKKWTWRHSQCICYQVQKAAARLESKGLLLTGR